MNELRKVIIASKAMSLIIYVIIIVKYDYYVITYYIRWLIMYFTCQLDKLNSII